MINATNHLGLRRRVGIRSAAIGLTMAIATLALLVASADGQERETEPFDVHGRVLDADNGQPVVGAWVGLPGSKWGSITNDEGRFRLPDLDAGPLVLSVENLGYQALVWEGTVTPDAGELELSLEPDAVVLDGLRIVVDRFRSRRNAVATSVFAYDLDDLTNTSQQTALDFVTLRSGASVTPCRGRRGELCLFARGRVVEPVVYIDEAPVLGGLQYLDVLAPHELYMVEVFAGGRHIRAYTPHFMERAAKQRLSPIALTF